MVLDWTREKTPRRLASKISGKYRIVFGNNDQVIGPGDSYSIPRDVEHCIEIIEPGEVLDVFSPPRKDYL